ncbi:aspartate aminotransferase family protein [Pelagibius litoralis]|uniref:Aspartate aminotransferase family protein n=1 Tax=Pelagibius litoralis TaxID=374515 RepID=A0A967KBM0_9PROT|nr:aspartate aminotransferase family protein [Pelagibius litoralis]NIA70439.1 aspartate aminotransferase family protein [Pelagibius litoralis]
MTTHFPKNGSTWVDLKQQLEATKADDYAWKRGRLPLYVYWRDEELYQVARDAYSLFFIENGLGKLAFPSVQKLEREVIGMVLHLLQADEAAGGSFTAGGTESIFQAVKTARDHARAERPGIGRPRIVVPQSAHPAFNKASHYLNMDVVRIPLGADFRADVAAMERAVDDDTIMIVGSAPAYPHGVFDPIEDLARLAMAKGVWLHVDACVGGLLAPFVRRLGYDIPPFDFAVNGVTSISADLHKYGFAAKGASLILFHDAGLQKYQRFKFSDWPRGTYATDTFLGTRPAGPVASAWAVINYLGEEGYLNIARTIMATRAKFAEGIAAILGLEVIEPSDLSFLLYRSVDPELDINAIAEKMAERGWFVGRCTEPSAIHLMFNPVHATIVDEYLEDLASVVSHVRRSGRVGVLDENTY